MPQTIGLQARAETLTLREPFQITGYTFPSVEILTITLSLDGQIGRGEACGVYYRGETVHSMREQIEAVRGGIEGGITRTELQEALPPGGARNALDCAMWDLEAKVTRRYAWQIAGLAAPKPLVTT